MLNWLKNFLIIVTVGGIIFLVVWGLFSINKDKEENPCHYNPQKCQCEEAGGLYFRGGFGADNCVFPPKQDK